MLPVPPLDGSHVVSWSLPRHVGEKFDGFAENYGSMLLLLLFVTNSLTNILGPPRNLVLGLIDAFLSRI